MVSVLVPELKRKVLILRSPDVVPESGAVFVMFNPLQPLMAVVPVYAVNAWIRVFVASFAAKSTVPPLVTIAKTVAALVSNELADPVLVFHAVFAVPALVPNTKLSNPPVFLVIVPKVREPLPVVIAAL